MRTVTSTIELNASPEEVWRVLTDTAGHADWNPFITELRGNLEVGNRIDVRIVAW